MATHVNFYETVKEAQIRLLNTVVLYEGLPYYVICISDHFGDGVFRIYLDALLKDKGEGLLLNTDSTVSNIIHGYPPAQAGKMLDDWLEQPQNKNKGLLRKMMNSPLFNKFRPFPLGMVNISGKVIYVERQPTRSTYQGLTQQMMNGTPVSIIPNPGGRSGSIEFTRREFAKTIVGDYPTPEECLKALTDDRVSNEGAAFHRLFALFRGPLDMMFLAYKGDIVGVLPNHDFSVVSVGKAFKHCKEVIQELGVFAEIKTR